MNPLEMTAETILDDSVFEELFDESNYTIFEREKISLQLLERAKCVGVKPQYEALYKAKKAHERQLMADTRKMEAEVKEAEKKDKERRDAEAREKQRKYAEERKIMQLHAMTEFQSEEYPDLFCGSWICDRNGIRECDRSGEVVACYHPILPVQRLINMENHTEKMLVAYNKDGVWKEQVFDKPTLLSASKITGTLTQFGILLSSENAKHLVRYFVEMEAMNIHSIPVQKATSKMGWVNGGTQFMPYIKDKSVVFDSESSFQSLFNSISEHGNKDKYIEFVRRVRNAPRPEPSLCIAASLASVLVKPCGTLPFIFHLYGEAGKGKTISLMLAASIWGDPNEGGFISDPKSTRTAFEMRLNFLNNLPFVCDDTAQMKKILNAQRNSDFSDFIYLVCHGKGNDRSNVNLGINTTTTWKNSTITSGEKPLTTDISQGGEMLRVLEYQTEDGEIFQNSRGTADFIRCNYGFLGKMFIETIQRMGIDTVKRLYLDFAEKLEKMDVDSDKEGKQLNAYALMLAADKILADEILRDKTYLDIDDCFALIKSNKQMSDNERAYEFIMNEVRLNLRSFTETQYSDPPQRWGYLSGGYVQINPNIFDGMCERGNFSKKLFMAWALKKGLAIAEKGRLTKTVYQKGKFIHVKMDGDIYVYAEIKEDE